MSFASSSFAPPGSSSGPGQRSGSPRECSEVPLVDDCARRFGEKRCGDAHKSVLYALQQVSAFVWDDPDEDYAISPLFVVGML